MLRTFRAFIFVAVCAFAASTARASFHTYQISEIFSNADGTIQFVELHEAAGATGQNFLAGLSLVSSSGSNQKTFVFPANLPSFATAGTFVLIATQGFANLGLVAPDYIIPNGFLFGPAGAVNYANVDSVSYNSLPGDGTTSINRAGAPQTNSPTNFAGVTGRVTGPVVPPPASGVNEFFNAQLNHYFLTADPVEAASIDNGGSGPGWVRTGKTFKPGGPNAVCRFFGVQAAGGPNGHFYTADPAECAAVRNDPGWHFESLDFSITPPNPGGVCPAGLANVYRAYNGRFAQHDSNHRITANLADYQQQIAAGWQGEGIVMCAQP